MRFGVLVQKFTFSFYHYVAVIFFFFSLKSWHPALGRILETDYKDYLVDSDLTCQLQIPGEASKVFTMIHKYFSIL